MSSDPILRSFRHKHHVKLRHLAREMGMSHVYLRDIELGNRPTPEGFAQRFMRTVRSLKKPNVRVAA